MRINKYNHLSEQDIIYKYLQRLNFKKLESFNFKNDGAFLFHKLNQDIAITNDTIVESIDFFKYDEPESIAQKIVTCNLSDLSSMGVDPYAYTLSLSIPNKTNHVWIKKFTNKLLYLQKKYNFFLLGGDICKSNQIQISANFFGYIKNKHIITRELSAINDDIWVTGSIGDSFIGLLLKKNKINIDKKLQDYFLQKYLYPTPSMIGSQLINYSKSAIDISDGFIGDLSKLLNGNLGADISYAKIPFSRNASILINKKLISSKKLMCGGDDYELIFTSSVKNEFLIRALANKNKTKISKVCRIIEKKGIFIDGKKIHNINNSYQYFF